jgi:hypothetical protein
MKASLMIYSIVFLAIFYSHHAMAQKKGSKEYFVKLLEQGKYRLAFDDAYEIRKNEEYGKNPFTSYIMAKALCLIGETKKAEAGFKFILTEYEMVSQQKKFMLDEMTKCGTPAAVKTSLNKNMFTSFIMNKQLSPRAGSMGKMGYVLDCNSEPGAFKIDSNFDNSQAEKRIFEIDQAKIAAGYYRNFLEPGYKVFPSGNFLIITRNANALTAAAANSIAKRLNNGIEYFHNAFNLRKPGKIIAVFLLNNNAGLQQMAKKLHGITLSKSNIGYSNLSDLTLLGISSESKIGTLYHELFHLTVRADIGDIPGWLDEGVASLYETSHWQGNSLLGNVSNWRTMVLNENRKAGKPLPQLAQLIDENWDGFFFNETNTACDVALNYAMAKHFAIYLQEQNLLKPVLQAFKNRKNVFSDVNTTTNESSESVLARATGKSMEKLQADFFNWLKDVYKIPVEPDLGAVYSKLYYYSEMLPIDNNGNALKADNDKYKTVLQSGSLPSGFFARLKKHMDNCDKAIANKHH